MKKIFLYFLIFISLMLTIGTVSASTVAFIYSTDSSSANAFKSLLDPAGFTTDLILSGNIATTDFSKYDLIILGSDLPGSGLNSALPSSDINKISSSGKPLIGLGLGGSYLFGSLGLMTNYGQSWFGNSNSIYVMDTTHPVFNKPKSIFIPASKIIQLYSSTDNELAVYLPTIPSNVIVLGMESATDGNHYSFTLENSKYVHWGFTAAPASMTEVGKDLFINTVNFLVPQNPPNIPSQPAGQSSGFTGTSYAYSTSSIDPNSDQIKYTFDWGDGSQDTTTFFNSGLSASSNHSWTNPGTYNVKAMAIDKGGLTSTWSTSFTVTIAAPALTPTPSPTPIPTLIPLTVTVASDPSSVAIGQTSTITVIVTGADGKEISGTGVMLAASKEGKVNPATGTTDLFGQVTSTFTGSAAGKATVRALVKKEGFEDGKEEIQITVSPAPTPTTAPLALMSGKVKDARTGEPIRGATIEIDGKLTTTGQDGTYELRISAGEYNNLTVSKSGYEKIIKSASIPETGAVLDLSIAPQPEFPWSWIILILIIILILAGIGAFLWIVGKLQLIPKVTSIPGDGKSTVPVRIQFINILGKPKKKGSDREIEMETTAGTVQNVVLPPGKEYVEAILTSSKECGTVTITARSGKQKATAQVEFTCSEAGLDVEISPPMIPADGKSTATVIIKIKDDKGSYLTSLIERTVELTTTSGTITSPVKIPQKTLAGIGVITSAQTSGTAKVIASCCPPKGGGKALYGEGKVVFGELAKRYCMHCGTMMTMEAQSCPSCGKIPPSGVDTKQCSTCGAVLPLSAKFCDKCGAKQPV